VNGPRPRGRAGALGLVALLAIASALVLLQGSSIKTAYARPLSVGSQLGPPLVGHRPAVTVVPAWEIVPPGAADAVIPAGRSTISVPILMYHYIRRPPSPADDRLGFGLSTSPEDFRQQMDYLDDHGFHPVTLDDVRAYFAGTRALPDRPVVLTFDDGYQDLYTEAFPVLKQHHFKAVAYIVSGFVGRVGQNVTAAQVREMDAYGIEIGAHTVNHVDLTKAGGSLWYEVKGSKDALEALLGHAVVDFCYPSGRYNDAVIAAVDAAGFQSATTTQPGAAHSLGDRFNWSRVRVSGSESIEDFAKGLEQHETGIFPSTITPIRIPRAYPLIFIEPATSLS